MYLIVTWLLYNYQHHTTGGMFGVIRGSSSWHFFHQSFHLLLAPLPFFFLFLQQVLLKMPSGKQTAVKYYVGVDVGSASVRAALVDGFGTVVAYAEQPIQVWEPRPDHYEQSSADIWAACCSVTKVGKDKRKDLCCRWLCKL